MQLIDIFSQIIKDIEEFKKVGVVPKNWFWHKEQFGELQTKDKILAEDLESFWENYKLHLDNYEKYFDSLYNQADKADANKLQEIHKEYLESAEKSIHIIIERLVNLYNQFDALKKTTKSNASFQKRYSKQIKFIISDLINKLVDWLTYLAITFKDIEPIITREKLRKMVARLIKQLPKDQRKNALNKIKSYNLDLMFKHAKFDIKRYEINLRKALKAVSKINYPLKQRFEFTENNSFNIRFVFEEGADEIIIDTDYSIMEILFITLKITKKLTFKELLDKNNLTKKKLIDIINQSKAFQLFVTFLNQKGDNLITKDVIKYLEFIYNRLDKPLIKTTEIESLKKEMTKETMKIIQMSQNPKFIDQAEKKNKSMGNYIPKLGDLYHGTTYFSLSEILDTGILCDEPRSGIADNLISWGYFSAETTFFADFWIHKKGLTMSHFDTKWIAMPNNDRITLIFRPSEANSIKSKDVLEPLNYFKHPMGRLLANFPEPLMPHAAVYLGISSVDLLGIITGGKTNLQFLKKVLTLKKRFIPLFDHNGTLLFSYKEYKELTKGI